MKKGLYLALSVLLAANIAMAEGVFDSMDSATEVKLAPAVESTTKTAEAKATKVETKSAEVVEEGNKLKEEKYNSALDSLDDAQVELRQELADLNGQYTEALAEKEKAISHCKELKKEINAVNTKMKNIEKSKKMINKNLETNK